jgi:hypothetical protein
MTIELIQGAVHLFSPAPLMLHLFHSSIGAGSLWIAEVFKDNLFSNMGQAWDNFIKTGQVWALMIGFFVGYIFRSITSY